MISIAVAGAAGRMGRTITSLVAQDAETNLVHAYEFEGSSSVGIDVGALAGIGDCGVEVTAGIGDRPFDVLIDFTTPDATLANLDYCRRHQRAIVIGTTGLTGAQTSLLEEAGRDTAVVFARNMSVGVNLTLKILEMTSRVLNEGVDVEVIEAHHKHKVDAPSGTALAMGEAVASSWGKDLDEIGVFSRHGQIGPRPDGCIGFSTIRAGDVVGEHTVMFASEGERIEITHKASNRANFAAGAVRAAKWLHGREKGLYSMHDVLGF